MSISFGFCFLHLYSKTSWGKSLGDAAVDFYFLLLLFGKNSKKTATDTVAVKMISQKKFLIHPRMVKSSANSKLRMP